METRQLRSRPTRARRAFVSLLAFGVFTTLTAGPASAAPPSEPSMHIALDKSCVASTSGGPLFVITNVSKSYGPAEDISVVIKDRPQASGTAGVVTGTVVLEGGAVLTLTTAKPSFTVPAGKWAIFIAGPGWSWKSAQPDRLYWAHFKAANNRTGRVGAMRVPERCACSNPS